jgi:hypothetical protein
MNAKPIWQSKTFLFNATALAMLGIQWAIGHNWVKPADSAFMLGAANIVLRMITNQPVTILGVKGPDAQGGGDTLNVGG